MTEADAVKAIIEKASKDPSFYALALKDPKQALKQFSEKPLFEGKKVVFYDLYQGWHIPLKFDAPPIVCPEVPGFKKGDISILNTALVRASKDSDFFHQLLKNPLEALSSTDIDKNLLKACIFFDAAKEKHIPLARELSDEELKALSGGTTPATFLPAVGLVPGIVGGLGAAVGTVAAAIYS